MAGCGPRTMSVFFDETGAHDCAYFAWGSIWMAHERLDEFNAKIDGLAKKHGVKGEFGWKDTTSRTDFCVEVVRWFFQQRWLCFQALFVRKRDMRIFSRERDHNDAVAYKKLLCTMVALQTVKFDALPGGPREFRVIVDRVGDRPSMAEEEYRILEATIRKWSDRTVAPVTKFARVDSQSARGIQLADLLVGAIRAEWEGGERVKRQAFRRMLADCLGWEHLRATTPMNLKFNIWLHNACQGFAVRPMDLKYPAGDPGAALGGRFGFGSGRRVGYRADNREDAVAKVRPVEGAKVRARDEGGLTLTITRKSGVGGAEEVLGLTRKQAKSAEKVRANARKMKAEALVSKQAKEEERARVKEERAKAKAKRVKAAKIRRAWAKKKAKERARAKEARLKEKAASRKAAKPHKKAGKKSK